MSLTDPSPMASLRSRYPFLIPTKDRLFTTFNNADIGSDRERPAIITPGNGSRKNEQTVHGDNVVCLQYITPHSIAVMTLLKLYAEHVVSLERQGISLNAKCISTLLVFISHQLQPALKEPDFKVFLDDLESLDSVENGSSENSRTFFRRIRLRLERHLIIAKSSLDIFDSLLEHIFLEIFPSQPNHISIKPNSILGVYSRQFRLEWLSYRASGQFLKITNVFLAFNKYVHNSIKDAKTPNTNDSSIPGINHQSSLSFKSMDTFMTQSPETPSQNIQFIKNPNIPSGSFNTPKRKSSLTPNRSISSKDNMHIRGSPFAYKNSDFTAADNLTTPKNKLFDLSETKDEIDSQENLENADNIKISRFYYGNGDLNINSMLKIHGVLSTKQVKQFLEKCVVEFSTNSISMSSNELNSCLSYFSKYFPENPLIDYVACLNEQRCGNYDLAIEHLNRYFVFCAKQELFSGRTKSMHHYEMLATASIYVRSGELSNALKTIEMAIPHAQEVKDQPCLNLLQHWKFYINSRLCKPFGNNSSYYHDLLFSSNNINNYNKTASINHKRNIAEIISEESSIMVDNETINSSFKPDHSFNLNKNRNIPKPLYDALFEGELDGNNEEKVSTAEIAGKLPLFSLLDRFDHQEIWNINSSDKVIKTMVSKTRDIGQIQLQFLNMMASILHSADSANVDLSTLTLLQDCLELVSQKYIRGAYIGTLRILQSYIWSYLGSSSLSNCYYQLQSDLPLSETPSIDKLKGRLGIYLMAVNSGSPFNILLDMRSNLTKSLETEISQSSDTVSKDFYLLQIALLQIDFMVFLRRGNLTKATEINEKILSLLTPYLNIENLKDSNNMSILRQYKFNVSKLQRKRGEYQIALDNIIKIVSETEPKSLSTSMDVWEKNLVSIDLLHTTAEHIEYLISLSDIYLDCENPSAALSYAIKASALATFCGLLYLRDKAIVSILMAMNQSGMTLHSYKIIESHAHSILRCSNDLWLRSKFLQVSAETIVLVSTENSILFNDMISKNNVTMKIVINMLNESITGFSKLEDIEEKTTSITMLKCITF